MSDQFTFESNGIVRKTGMKMPETRPLGHAAYPETELLSIEDCYEILRNPDRVEARFIEALKRNLNQGPLSSCNLYAAAKMMINNGYFAGLGLYSYAPEFNYHLIAHGRDEGSLLPDGMNSLMSTGMPQRAKYPYGICTQRPSPEAMMSASCNKLLEVNQMPNRSVELHWQAMVSSACRRQAMVTAVHVARKWMDVDRLGIVGFDDGPGNHAIAITDAALHPKLNGGMPRSWGEFLLWHDGSWDEGYGLEGGGYITIEHSIEPMQWHATYGGRSISRTDRQGAAPNATAA